MSTNDPTITRADAESLAAKLAEFGRSLPAPEQALLWEALSSAPSGSSDGVQGYGLVEYSPFNLLIYTVFLPIILRATPLGPSAHPFAVPSHPSARV